MSLDEEPEERRRRIEVEVANLKYARSGRAGRALIRARAEVVAALHVEGHAPRHLLECSGLKRSTCYHALGYPPRVTRPELWEAMAAMFSRTANGCSHRQVAMCLRVEEHMVHRNTRRRQVRLEDLIPEEFRNQVQVA